MKIEHLPSPFQALVSKLTLETETERALSDNQLMRICGNLRAVSYDYDRDSYFLNGNSFGPAVSGRKPGRPEDATVRIVQVPF